MRVTLKHAGSEFISMTAAELVAKDVPTNVVAEAFKSKAVIRLIATMNTYRNKVASACAGKLIAYQFKAAIAAAPDDASEDDLALIDREATARGMARQDLLDLITAKHAAYRNVALLIEALEAEAKLAIAAVPEDAPDLEAACSKALASEMAKISTKIEPALASLDVT